MLTQIEAILRAALQGTNISEDRIKDALAVLRGDIRVSKSDVDEPKRLEPVVKRRQVAELLGITLKGVDYHAQHGRLVRVMVGSRACGYTAASVRKLLTGKEG